MIGEPFTRRGPEWLDEVQVVMSGHSRAVPQVGRQHWQFGLDVGSGPIPSQQGIDGEAVAEIVNPRWLAVWRADAAPLKQRSQTESQARAAVCPAAPESVSDERRLRGNRKSVLCANAQIPVDFIGYAVIDRKQA